jgi:hypothetical protein
MTEGELQRPKHTLVVRSKSLHPFDNPHSLLACLDDLV